MTDYEILSKAIIKLGIYYHYNKDVWQLLYNSECETYIERKRYYSLIFSHNFAKAVWGESTKILCERCEATGGNLSQPGHSCYFCKGQGYFLIPSTGWRYHLSKMVLEEEPLKYLEKFLD